MREPSADPAKRRFFIIQAIRLIGVAFVVFGMLVTAGRINLPWAVGALCVLNGLFDALFLPTLLARRWKSPDA